MTITYHLHDYQVRTAGAVPIEFRLFVSGMRSSEGHWIIEQLRLTGLPVIWLDPKQGHEIEMLRDPRAHIFPEQYAIWFLQRHLMNDPDEYSRLCGALDRQEESGRLERVA